MFAKIKSDMTRCFSRTALTWVGPWDSGEDLGGVYDSITFLKDVNLGRNTIKVGEKVAVVGGGNAAIDAARTAPAARGEEVTIVYRRQKEDMPAAPEEIHEAQIEGVESYLALPVEARALGARSRALPANSLSLRSSIESGRRSPKAIEDCDF